MPPKTVTSALAKKYGAKLAAAIEQHGKEKSTAGIPELPAGIRNGIAMLSKCYFKEFEATTNQKKADGTSAAGEWYWRGEGTIIMPKVVDTPNGPFPVEGLTTSIMEPVCDTVGGDGDLVPLEKHIDNIFKHFRALGGEDFTQTATINDMEALAEILQASADPDQTHIYFWFSTSASKSTPKYPNPRVFQNWNGTRGLENYVPEETPAFSTAEGGVVVPPPSANGAANRTVNEVASGGNTTPDSGVVDTEGDPFGELSDLLERANGVDDDAVAARNTLIDKAVEVGYDRDYIEGDEVTSWAMVVELIQNPPTEADPEPEPVPPPPPPPPPTKAPATKRATPVQAQAAPPKGKSGTVNSQPATKGKAPAATPAKVGGRK